MRSALACLALLLLMSLFAVGCNGGTATGSPSQTTAARHAAARPPDHCLRQPPPVERPAGALVTYGCDTWTRNGACESWTLRRDGEGRVVSWSRVPGSEQTCSR